MRYHAEPQQILSTAENEGKFKIIFKEEVSYHLCHGLRARLWTPSVGSERWRQANPLSAPQVNSSAQVHGLLLLGFRNIQWKGRGWARGVLRPLQVSPAQGTKGKVHSQS